MTYSPPSEAPALNSARASAEPAPHPNPFEPIVMISPRRHRPRTDPRRLAAVAVMIGALAAAAPGFGQTSQSAGANSVDASANRFQGVLGVNQDAGAGNDQANAVAAATSAGDPSAAMARISIDAEAGPTCQIAPSVQTNTISASFNNSVGIAQVNQATGEGNAQINAVALAFDDGAAFSPALTDIQLKAVAGPATAAGASSAAAGSGNSIDNSFNGFNGIAQVQQIAGDRNVVVNVVSIAMGGGG